MLIGIAIAFVIWMLVLLLVVSLCITAKRADDKMEKILNELDEKSTHVHS